MNELKLATITTEDPSRFTVHWYMGKNTNGRLEVRVPRDVEDRDIIAELWALRYLLVDKAIFGEDRTGEGLYLEVTHGAIRKVFHRITQKTHLIGYAQFMGTRFLDASIKVCKDLDWVDATQDKDIEPIEVGSPIYEHVHLTGVGPVQLTRHALERHHERNKTRSFSAAFKSIRKVAASPILRHVNMPADWKKRMRNKHGIPCELYYHQDSQTDFVVGQGKNGTKVLVTVYHTDTETRLALPVYRGAFREPS